MATINVDALERYMKKHNLTLRKMARKLRVDPSHFWRIMRGEKEAGGKVISAILNMCLTEGLDIRNFLFLDEPLSGDNETSATRDSA